MTDESKVSKVIEKIKALRRIADSTHSLAESQTCLNLAAKLIAEFALEEAQLQEKESSDPSADIDIESESIIYETGRVNLWKSELAIGIAKLNGLYMYNAVVIGSNGRKRSRYRVIGRKDDIALGLYMFSYMESTINELSDLYAMPTGRRGVNPEKESWSFGCVRGFLDKMFEEKKNAMKQYEGTTALVLVSNRAEVAKEVFLAKTNMKLGKSSYRSKASMSSDAMASGYRKGKTLSVGSGKVLP